MKPTVRSKLMEQAGQELLPMRIAWDPELIRQPNAKWALCTRLLAPHRKNYKRRRPGLYWWKDQEGMRYSEKSAGWV